MFPRFLPLVLVLAARTAFAAELLEYHPFMASRPAQAVRAGLSVTTNNDAIPEGDVTVSVGGKSWLDV